MTACLATFLVNIDLLGVNPAGYSRFVTYTTNTLLPPDDELATSAQDLFSGLTAATVLSIILLILFTVVLLVIVMVSIGAISLVSAACLIAFTMACLAIYYAIGYVYSKKVASEIALPLQQDVRTTGILIVNSILRDAIFLGLCA